MPASACPATVQRYSYVPGAVNVTINADEVPTEMSDVSVPTQLVAVPSLGTEHTSKSCGSAPALLTLNVTAPSLTVVAESENWNSDGFPATTVTVETGGSFVTAAWAKNALTCAL